MNQSPDSKFKPADRIQSQNATQPLTNGFLSTPQLAIYISLLLIFAGAAQPITDSDFWWHLRTGQYIVATKAVPHTDIFSAMRFGSEWVAHEWLSEVFTYSVFRWLGYGGLIVIFSGLVTATFWMVYQRCRRRMIHPYVVVIALLLGALASISTWGVRPHVFSFFLA